MKKSILILCSASILMLAGCQNKEDSAELKEINETVAELKKENEDIAKELDTYKKEKQDAEDAKVAAAKKAEEEKKQAEEAAAAEAERVAKEQEAAAIAQAQAEQAAAEQAAQQQQQQAPPVTYDGGTDKEAIRQELIRLKQSLGGNMTREQRMAIKEQIRALAMQLGE
ncbi:hypothetical protein [Isobaculum melis]|uniref:Uncharacterized protein n=1 Tax=Isobaculum melis TaxID=142588 RepID=A0A1H9U0C0_9LACT|nr:hypothetical protein [Isobaculum melis]SES02819.1 hypothetical protein SAMN04488559_11915 [Isobaculum melis]